MLTTITNIEQLPDQWFGYDAVDLIVLSTSNRDFIARLFSEGSDPAMNSRCQALLNWIRRGGRIVVAVGTQAELISQLKPLERILPVTIDPHTPPRHVSELTFQWPDRESGTQGILSGTLASRTASVFVANLIPRNGQGRVVIPPPDRRSRNPTIIAVQGSFDLGRVTVIAFDVDQAPFIESSERLEFWDWILRGAGAARASIGNESRVRAPTHGVSDDEDELTAALRNHMDTFEGIPVISFGWIAVLIVLYMILIAPLEYLLLKRVLGRMELTWLTFPFIVLTVSVAAYSTADTLKGRDLRINKIDIIEVIADSKPDSGRPTGRIYGTTWVTLFSPRIDTYTINIQPTAGWSSPAHPADQVVSWFGGPQGGRASLVRRRYHYQTDGPAIADALDDVPIHVWSTKSFIACWAAEMLPTLPAVESHLIHPPGAPDLVVGTFINRLPFHRIDDCLAIYGDKAYPLGTILPDTEIRLILDPNRESPAYREIQERSQFTSFSNRRAVERRFEDNGQTASSGSGPPSRTELEFPMWNVLFHESSLKNEPGVYPTNASLRRLDQSWRLTMQRRDEVIIVGRVAPHVGSARDIEHASTSPTMLVRNPHSQSRGDDLFESVGPIPTRNDGPDIPGDSAHGSKAVISDHLGSEVTHDQ